MTQSYRDFGVGVGLRPQHHSIFLKEKPRSASWVEVISENYMPWNGWHLCRAAQTLIQIRRDYPVALHGVSMNLGSVDPVDEHYLSRLKQLIDCVDPFIVSDHLAWTGVQGKNLHDLLPLPYDKDTLEVMINKIDFVQNFLGRHILVENPSSYFEFQTSEMSEPDFLAALTKQTGCGLLLDVNNIYVSSCNHGWDVLEYLQQVPAEKVEQIHLAGHRRVKKASSEGVPVEFLIDTHDAPVCDEVWALYERALEILGARSVMIERDGNIPDWSELEKELVKLAELKTSNLRSASSVSVGEARYQQQNNRQQDRRQESDHERRQENTL
jgi:uncharacterized protein